jgi:ribosome-binding factor A
MNMEETKRQKQVGKLIQAELSEIFQRTGINITQGGMLSVSKVSMTPDLIEARVYLSLFQIPDTKQVLADLKERNWEYRKMLGERVRHQLRRVPYIEFFIDDTLDYVFKMEEVFKKLNEEQKSNPSSTEQA